MTFDTKFTIAVIWCAVTWALAWGMLLVYVAENMRG